MVEQKLISILVRTNCWKILNANSSTCFIIKPPLISTDMGGAVNQTTKVDGGRDTFIRCISFIMLSLNFSTPSGPHLVEHKIINQMQYKINLKALQVHDIHLLTSQCVEFITRMSGAVIFFFLISSIISSTSSLRHLVTK